LTEYFVVLLLHGWRSEMLSVSVAPGASEPLAGKVVLKPGWVFNPQRKLLGVLGEIGATQIHPILPELGLVIVILPLNVQVLLPDFEVQITPLIFSVGITTGFAVGVGLGSGVGEGVTVGTIVAVGRTVAVGAKPRMGSCI
jgi:hypothetical protein